MQTPPDPSVQARRRLLAEADGSSFGPDHVFSAAAEERERAAWAGDAVDAAERDAAEERGLTTRRDPANPFNVESAPVDGSESLDEWRRR